MINYPNFGQDFVIGPSPGKISGINNLVSKIVRRLRAVNGSLSWDPAYGLDVRQYLNTQITTAKLQEIKQSVKAQCELDERVLQANVTVENTQNLELFITIKIITQPGPNFTFILKVNKLTLELLTANVSS
jgi:phage baseplate assembly protein W